MLGSNPGWRDKNAKSSSDSKPAMGRYRSTEKDSIHSGVMSSMVVFVKRRRNTGVTPSTHIPVRTERATSRANCKKNSVIGRVPKYNQKMQVAPEKSYRFSCKCVGFYTVCST